MNSYVETSALVKLVVEEPESEPLRRWLDQRDRPPTSSDLARTELLRAAKRLAPELVPEAQILLDSLTLLELPSAVFDHAGRLDPAHLRSLDALHLASAFTLGDELEAIVTYDDRLAAAARARGITVVSPS